MTNLDISVLKHTTQLLKAIENNDINLVESLVNEVNIAHYSEVQLAAISDALVSATYAHVNEAHLYVLENVNNLPDSQILHRVVKAKFMFNAPVEKRKEFVRSMLDEDKIFTGHQTDFFFCSLLIRLSLSAQDFDAIDIIQDFLNNRPEVEE